MSIGELKASSLPKHTYVPGIRQACITAASMKCCKHAVKHTCTDGHHDQYMCALLLSDSKALQHQVRLRL